MPWLHRTPAPRLVAECATPPLSPGGMSPTSPPTSDTCTQIDPSENSNLMPQRLCTLEDRCQVHAAEIALLRQQGDEVTAWRSRVDSASTQTARVLQALDEDLKGIKCLTVANGKVLSPPNASEDRDVCNRLLDIESQLCAARACIDGMNSILNVEMGDLKSSVSEMSAVAQTAMEVGTEGKQYALTALNQVEAINSEVQTLRLGLEVVEHSLEDVDGLTESMDALRSRMDDLDSEMILISKRANSSTLIQRLEERVLEVHKRVEAMEIVASRADIKAATAEAIAQSASSVLISLQNDIAVLKEATTLSGASGLRMDTVLDTRLRAAVHTLSDGYKSLHRAMSLMYEEQSDVARKVATVGRAAVRAVEEGSFTERMKQLNAKSSRGSPKSALAVVSHPLRLLDNEDKGEDNVEHQLTEQQQIAQLLALVGLQARDAVQNSKRIEVLEEELTALRQALNAFNNPLATLTQRKDPSSTHSIQRKEDLPNGNGYKPALSLKEAHADVNLQYDEVGDKVHLKLRLTGDEQNAEFQHSTDSAGWNIPSTKMHTA